MAATAMAAVLLLGSCGGDDEPTTPEPETGAPIQVESDAFADGEAIPVEFSCDGDDLPPPLGWDAVEAEEYAITMIDPDAGDFVHWIRFGIPAADDMTFTSDELGSTGVGGANDRGDNAYAGPCPPEGDDPHDYVITVYALDHEVSPGLEEGASLDEFLDAIGCCVVAEGTLTGTFGR